MIFERLGTRIRKLREARRLSQAQVAERCGIPRDRLSIFECGRRVPTPEQLEQIARALDVDVPEPVKNTDWLSPQERALMRRASARVTREFARTFRYEPPRDRDMSTRLRMALARYGTFARGLLGQIRERSDGLCALRVLSTVVAGSALEVLVHLLLLASGVIVLVAPELVGFRRHPVVDPSTREAVGSRDVPAFRVDLGTLRCIFIPQVGMACRRGTWCVDLLCGVIDARGSVSWIYVEIDGEGHDFSPNPVREEDLAMPCVRVSESEVVQGDLMQILEFRVRNVINAAA